MPSTRTKAKAREAEANQAEVEQAEAEETEETNKKEDWEEPKPKWGKSKARKLLYLDIIEGRVPRTAKDENGRLTAKLKDIYNSRPEFKKYHYSKFSSRLSSLRNTIKSKDSRKELDQEAFDNYVANHPISYFSHKGYIQWQGSDAQELALEHIKENRHNEGKWKDWHEEYPEFYQNFELAVFKDKIRQEIRTAKYLHTLEVRGKDVRKGTKGNTNEPRSS